MIQKALNQMLEWARDDSHGYDQANRWGPDYDCSSAVIQAWANAGLPVKMLGASYTGNMYKPFIDCGFIDVTASVNLSTGAGLQPGDVLLNHRNHTAMHCGNGQTVEASINENGGVTGGMTGDQTGREFLVRAYRNYPWDCVLRYGGSTATAPETSTGTTPGVVDKTAPSYFYSVRLPLLKLNMCAPTVEALQVLLNAGGYYNGAINGMYNIETQNAVLDFQSDNELDEDGETGIQVWNKILNNI